MSAAAHNAQSLRAMSKLLPRRSAAGPPDSGSDLCSGRVDSALDGVGQRR